jgi:hypothetical protein
LGLDLSLQHARALNRIYLNLLEQEQQQQQGGSAVDDAAAAAARIEMNALIAAATAEAAAAHWGRKTCRLHEAGASLHCVGYAKVFVNGCSMTFYPQIRSGHWHYAWLLAHGITY